MSVHFNWSDSYVVGNDEIDEQHEEMFRLANSLAEHLDAPLIKRTIMDLYKHAREHFTAEEQMMKDTGYPRLEQHRRSHDGLITRLNDISAQSFDSDESVFAFKRFIYHWLIDHIMHQDKDFFQFAQQQAAKTATAPEAGR